MPELKTSDPVHITTVEEDQSGWFTVLTDGEPKKLKTKQENFGQMAGQFRRSGELVRVKYSERNDKPNPQGGFYHDYYFSGAEAVPVETNGRIDDDDGITRVKSFKSETSPEEAWRISLSVGTERAIQLAPHVNRPGGIDWAFVWALSYEIAARIYLTPPPLPNALDPMPVGGGGPGAYYDPTEPPGDDDIPF